VRELLRILEFLAEHLVAEDAARAVRIFDAVAFPPRQAVSLPSGRGSQAPRYDIALLIEASSPGKACALAQTRNFRQLLDPLQSQASHLSVLQGRCIRRIADVPADGGVHVFNYLMAGNEVDAVEVWELIAGFYQAEMSLDNSLLLAALPDRSSEYVAISHTCWQMTMAQLLARQFAQQRWVASILDELDRRGVGCLPYLYQQTACHTPATLSARLPAEISR
jgi:hypothetical protein